MNFYISCVLAVVLTGCYINVKGADRSVTCSPHQYLEMGTSDTIDCSITKPFNAVYWYNLSNHESILPFVSFQKNDTRLESYLSEEFSVQHDGSLVINNVSLAHEHRFKVVVLYPDNTLDAIILVSVTVKPHHDFPLIDQCKSESTCLRQLQHVAVLSCRVEGARPAVNLTWLTRNIDQDFILNSESYYIFDGVTTTTVANVTIDSHTVHVLALFICSADFSHNIMKRTESEIIIENSTYNVEDEHPKLVLSELHTNQTLKCGDQDSQLFVWKNGTSSANIFGTILVSTMSQSTPLTEGYTSKSNGELTLRDISVQREGLYFCSFGNGIRGGHQFYNLSVFAYPQDGALTISNCNLLKEGPCYIESRRTGTLRCGVRGVRPKVELEWIQTSASSDSVVRLQPQEQIIEINNETYDIYLEVTYRILPPISNLSFTCKVAGNQGMFNFTKEVTVLVQTDNDELPVHAFAIYAVLIGVAFFIMIASLLFIICHQRARGKRKKETNRSELEDGEEDIPLTGDDSTDNGQRIGPSDSLKTQFVKELKETYYNYCNRWPLLPSSGNKTTSLENGYVENILHKNNPPSQALNSRHDIFGDECSKRIFLIGDPGMGKTTLALKAAHDWCEQDPTSPLKNVDIFIFISLKDIEETSSIYRTIKTKLLPNGTDLKECDIELIMSTSSLVIIFDGFDEHFPDNSSDILDIIDGTLFPEMIVVTTTIPSYLPEKTKTEVTKIYIKGFNESTNFEDTSRTHDERVYVNFGTENVYYNYLSNVPMFLVLLKQIKNGDTDLKRLISVTHLFNMFMRISNDEKQKDSDSFEIFHNDMSEKAFENLNNPKQPISLVYDDDPIIPKVFFRYVKMGVFLGDLSKVENPGKLPREINFSHRLFQEWFAANRVVEILRVTPKGGGNDLLKKLDPRRRPYLFRFVSGLSKTAASRIIDYLMSCENCVSLAILCAFEKDGSCKHMENDTLKNLCNKTLKFQKDDSEFLQHSTTELLKYASDEKIKVAKVEFHSSLTIFWQISKLTSVKWNTPLWTVRHLTFREARRKLNTKEVVNIINTSSCCKLLETLSFISPYSPNNMERKDDVCNVKVNWKIESQYGYLLLNHNTGAWETPRPPQTPITPEEGWQPFFPDKRCSHS